MADENRYPYRSHEDLAADLIDLYDRSISGGVDWNGDTFRLLLGGIIDTAHLANDGFDVDAARARNVEKRRAVGQLLPGETTAALAPATADEIAASLLRQMQAQGLVQRDPQSSAVPSPVPDETIPAPVTVYHDSPRDANPEGENPS